MKADRKFMMCCTLYEPQQRRPAAPLSPEAQHRLDQRLAAIEAHVIRMTPTGDDRP